MMQNLRLSSNIHSHDFKKQEQIVLSNDLGFQYLNVPAFEYLQDKSSWSIKTLQRNRFKHEITYECRFSFSVSYLKYGDRSTSTGTGKMRYPN